VRTRTRVLSGAVLIFGLALAGCYGNTEPATNVRPNGATLNAWGTADKGPAYSYFEFWRAADPSRKVQSPTWHWPANASGHYSYAIDPHGVGIDPLLQNTSYEFRVCGNEEGKDAVCVPSRSFTTPRGDAIDGKATFSPTDTELTVDAWSGPGGESPQGHFSFLDHQQGFSGDVTCLSVHGNSAAVGAVGNYYFGNQYNGPAAALIQVQRSSSDPSIYWVDRQVTDVPTPDDPTLSKPVCPASPSASTVPATSQFLIQDG
jgi:hypothetical protein